MRTYDVLVVGAGFAGAVCAERLATNGKRVLLVEKRDHVGGNAFDTFDAHGVLVHPYGPHIFHTNSREVFTYLSRFTNWRFYEHRVRAVIGGRPYPIPINRTTLNELYGLDLDEEGAKRYLESVREPRAQITTSEDVVLSTVGHDLCEKFFRGYTRKQWGLDLSELSAVVAARIPTRTNDDDRYFTDTYNFMPVAGFTPMFEAILSHKNIDVQLSTDFFAIRDRPRWIHVIFTGPIDEYFGYSQGHLQYRSLRFEHEHISDCSLLQDVAVYNYPGAEVPYTRITEFKHITGQQHPGTSIVRESSAADGDPYYPIPHPQNDSMARSYRQLAATPSAVTFVGRLAQFRYFNMDQVVASALHASAKLLS